MSFPPIDRKKMSFFFGCSCQFLLHHFVDAVAALSTSMNKSRRARDVEIATRQLGLGPWVSYPTQKTREDNRKTVSR